MNKQVHMSMTQLQANKHAHILSIRKFKNRLPKQIWSETNMLNKLSEMVTIKHWSSYQMKELQESQVHIKPEASALV